MSQTLYRTKAADFLAAADIRINGDRPWDMQVSNDEFFARVFADGSLALGEAYMDSWWDCEALDVFFYKALQARLNKKIQPLNFLWDVVKAKLSNRQTKSLSLKVAEQHYNIGNDLYEKMLGRTMQYTCGYWNQTAKNLDEAQDQKLDLICKKINLQRGERVLELGCGFGGFAQFAASRYRAHVTAVNIADEQIAYAKKWNAGLPVEIVKSDYRDAKGSFDKVVSIGLAEHVGPKNYRTMMRVAERCLADGGLFICHTIGGNFSVMNTDPWIERYIFPNSVIPSAAQLSRAWEGLFVMEDWHNFGADYDKTLLAWWENFNNNWPALEKNYSKRFYRMWKYYLLSCAATFRSRDNNLWQMVLSKGGTKGGYTSVR